MFSCPVRGSHCPSVSSTAVESSMTAGRVQAPWRPVVRTCREIRRGGPEHSSHLFAGTRGTLRPSHPMPFFDQVPPDRPASPPGSSNDLAKSSDRRWLGWLSIPFPLVFATMGNDVLILVGLIAGWICIAVSRPQTRGLKWIFFALYPVVMGPVAGLLGFLTSSKPMRLF
jgi:hypothetical protein